MEKKIEKRFKEIEIRLEKIRKSYEKGKKDMINIVLPKLKLIKKILNTYHSQFPFIEVGRQNVLDDINNEVNLNELIIKLEDERKI